MERIVSWCLGNKSVVFLAAILLVGSGIYATTRFGRGHGCCGKIATKAAKAPWANRKKEQSPP